MEQTEEKLRKLDEARAETFYSAKKLTANEWLAKVLTGHKCGLQRR